MESLASQLIEEVTAYAQSDSLEDACEICADGTYFPNNLFTYCKDWYNEVSNLYVCQNTLLQRKKFFICSVFFISPASVSLHTSYLFIECV